MRKDTIDLETIDKKLKEATQRWDKFVRLMRIRDAKKRQSQNKTGG